MENVKLGLKSFSPLQVELSALYLKWLGSKVFQILGGILEYFHTQWDTSGMEPKSQKFS